MTKKEISMLAGLIAEKLFQLNQNRLLTAEEAAGCLGLKVKSLYNRKDELGFIKRGKRIYFKESAIKAYMEGR